MADARSRCPTGTSSATATAPYLPALQAVSFPAPRVLLVPSLGPRSWSLTGFLPQRLPPATVGLGNPDSRVRGLSPAWPGHRDRRRKGDSTTLGTNALDSPPARVLPSRPRLVCLSPKPVSPLFLCSRVHNTGLALKGSGPRGP